MPKTKRLTLEQMNLSTGKKARLARLLYGHGPGRGTMLVLPLDHGLEHGPGDFFVNPPSADPEFQMRLAAEGNFSAIAVNIGLAEKYWPAYAARVPLLLKLNGKTNVPSDDDAFSPLTASVKDAVRLGADAVGYTIYVGSPSQDRDFLQFGKVREEAEAYGMPLVVWSYPRGRAFKEKGGLDTLYAIDYAARVACELGADVVKLHAPRYDEAKYKLSPKPYNTIKHSYAEGVSRVIASAGRTMVLFSGGSKMGDKDVLDKARICLNCGATGLIFGRNLWQRKFSEGLKITGQVSRIFKGVR